MGTSKQVGGDRVSTKSQPGCNTSVVLATGPTEEEEHIHHDVVIKQAIIVNTVMKLLVPHKVCNSLAKQAQQVSQERNCCVEFHQLYL